MTIKNKNMREQELFSYKLTGKRNATVKLRHKLFVAHKHELHKLVMTRILTQAPGLICLPGMLVNIRVHVFSLSTVTFFFPSK